MQSKTAPPKSVEIAAIEPLLVSPDAPQRHERSDAAENRRRILDVAERLFAEKGVQNVCMQEIARAAGVGQGTLYRRFANKGELCLAMLDSQMSDFQNEVLSTLREMTQRGERRIVHLEWFLNALVHFNERHSPMLKAARMEFAPLPTAAMSTRSSPLMWQRLTAIGLLQSAALSRELRDGLDIPVIADALLCALHPLAFQDLRQGPHAYSLERISTALHQLVAGLKR